MAISSDEKFEARFDRAAETVAKGMGAALSKLHRLHHSLAQENILEAAVRRLAAAEPRLMFYLMNHPNILDAYRDEVVRLAESADATDEHLRVADILTAQSPNYSAMYGDGSAKALLRRTIAQQPPKPRK